MNQSITSLISSCYLLGFVLPVVICCLVLQNNVFADRRFGEKNETLSAEEKMMHRFALAKQVRCAFKHRKKSELCCTVITTTKKYGLFASAVLQIPVLLNIQFTLLLKKDIDALVIPNCSSAKTCVDWLLANVAQILSSSMQCTIFRWVSQSNSWLLQLVSIKRDSR